MPVGGRPLEMSCSAYDEAMSPIPVTVWSDFL